MREPLLLLLCAAALHAQPQITRPWVATYNGQGDFNDRFTCTTRDSGGNLYLAGSVSNSDANRDFVVVKLNSTGTQVWRAELDGTGGGPDEALAIAVNASGDVYVAGFARSANTGTDFLTVRYNSAGVLQWANYYNNPAANGYDQANAIAIDASNNVYVTGQSDGDPTSAEVDDYATIKYANNGNQQWAQRYNGTGNGPDRPEGIAVDASGNVYVSGRAWNGLDDDFATVKYSTLGALQWTQVANRGGRDRSTDVVLDASANVYVTGRSFNGTNEDFYTIKYNSAGVQQWAMVYDFGGDDRPVDMAIDAAANVYVTGHSDGDATLPGIDWDYQTVAYNTAGVQLWQQRYDGTASQDDFPNAIATDGTAVYVTGEVDADATANVITDVVTRSYSPATGTLNWSATFAAGAGMNDAGRDVVATTSGCLVAGDMQLATPNAEAIGLRYSAIGVLSWQHVTNAPGDNNDNVRALRVDGSNNVFAAGYSVESRMDRNMSLVKLSSSGTVLCHYNLDGTANGSPDEAQGVELTATGDPVVAGYTKNSGESNDLTWYRMNTTTCDTVWTKRLATAADGSDRVYDMTKDAAGNFYVTGRTDTDPTFTANDDVYTAKFNASGTVLWSSNYTSVGIDEDRGSYVRVAASGNVYVTGRTWNGVDFDILLLKYNSLGAQQWVQVYSGGLGTDEPNGLVIDAAENVYVVGRAEEATNNVYNYVTLKYSAAGALQWSQQYNGSGAGDDQGEGIALDASGNVYVTGFSDRAALAVQNMDIVTLKYSSAGSLLWEVNHNGSSGDKDIGDAIAVNSSGQVVVAGHATSGGVGAFHYDAVLLVYDATGTLLFTDGYNSAGNGNEVPSLLLLNGTDFYVAGYTETLATGRDMLVIKYTGTASGIAVAPKVFLGGPYVSGSGLMSDALRTLALVPSAEPYTALGYTYVGAVNSGATAPVFATAGNNAVVDWVVVELRSSANAATVVASRPALLQRDGDVVGIDGASPVTFGMPAASYFLAIRHRNHFGVMRSAALALSSTTSVVDFTLPATVTFGTNAQQTVGAVKVLWSGNTVRDGQIKYTGVSNDRDPILSAIGGTIPTNTIAGYRLEDVNMDGTVKYTGVSNDRDPILSNIGGTVPTSVITEQLP